MKWPADRIANSSKKSFGVYEKTIPLMKQGIDVIHLEVGLPGFDTPRNIKEATKQALDAGHVHYSVFSGIEELRLAITNDLQSRYELTYSPDEIIVTNGLTHASYAVLMAAIDPGDEVILLDPYYPQHINKIELAGGNVVLAPLNEKDDFRIDGDAIRACVTPRTKMISIVNPANPTGRVFSKDELKVIADIAIENDLLVMSDEVYERIVYDDNRHTCLASLPGMRERTFSLYAFTKAYAMDGWRVGYIAASSNFIPALLKVTKNDVAHVNTFIQHGAVEALTGPQDDVAAMLAEDDRCRHMVCDVLNSAPGMVCSLPEGTIYAFADVRNIEMPSQALAERILEKCHVAVEAGSFYGPSGEGYLRICFGAEPFDRIKTGVERIGDFLSSLDLAN